MNVLEEALRALVVDLRHKNLSFALAGGLAVSVHAEPRLTRDVDVAVSVADDEEAEDVIRRLGSIGYVTEIALEHEARNRLSAVRMTHSDRPEVVLDLLFASSGIEPEIVGRAQPIEVLSGLTIPVTSIGDLIALKLLARDDRGRPADFDDLRGLLAIADEEDLAVARASVELIDQREFNRGRDLIDALETLIST